MKSTFLPEFALNLDAVDQQEESAESYQVGLALMLLNGAITEQEFNQAVADYRLVNSISAIFS